MSIRDRQRTPRQHAQGVVAGDARDLLDFQPLLEQPGRVFGHADFLRVFRQFRYSGQRINSSAFGAIRNWFVRGISS
jgi:hypothetical protein